MLAALPHAANSRAKAASKPTLPTGTSVGAGGGAADKVLVIAAVKPPAGATAVCTGCV